MTETARGHAPHSAAALGRWMIASSTVTGASHLALGRGGDDAHAWAAAPGERIYFAVADGVGSASAASTGSALAAETALFYLIRAPELLETDDPELALDTIREAFHAVARAVTGAATRDGLQPADLGTTLCCGVLTPQWCAAGQIGDGAVVIAEPPDGELRLLIDPQDIGTPGLVYSAGDVRDDALLRRRMTTGVSGPVLALAATSDGLLDVAFRDEAPFAPFFRPLIASVGRATSRPEIDLALERFLASERVAQAARDDLTLVVIADRERIPELARRWAAERVKEAAEGAQPAS